MVHSHSNCQLLTTTKYKVSSSTVGSNQLPFSNFNTQYFAEYLALELKIKMWGTQIKVFDFMSLWRKWRKMSLNLNLHKCSVLLIQVYAGIGEVFSLLHYFFSPLHHLLAPFQYSIPFFFMSFYWIFNCLDRLIGGTFMFATRFPKKFARIESGLNKFAGGGRKLKFIEV